jgi:hypothetical protein
MASMLAMTLARSAPIAMELSVRLWPEAAWAPAGDGVAGGAALAVVEPAVWVGAAGAAGVAVVVRAGVSGTELDEADVVAAAVSFGCDCVSEQGQFSH